MVLGILNGELSPGNINQTYIYLITKVKRLTSPSEFCLISACNVCFKIISKIAANRIKSILPHIIVNSKSHLSQTEL